MGRKRPGTMPDYTAWLRTVPPSSSLATPLGVARGTEGSQLKHTRDGFQKGQEAMTETRRITGIMFMLTLLLFIVVTFVPDL
jgi:hypothetical protein